jgi:hypothetical protein
MSMNEIDLDIALKTIHGLASAEGDLGREYWKQIASLLTRAAGMQSVIDSLSQELELCRVRQQNRGHSTTTLKGFVRTPLRPVSIDDMDASPVLLDEELLARAQALTGLEDKTALVKQALLALIRQKNPAD